MALLLTTVVPTVYAEENTALLSYYAGDVNGDWTIDTNDVRVIFLAVSGASENIGLPLAADVDRDGTINTMDALTALQSAVGAISPVLVKPTFGEANSTPDGEVIEFTRTGDRYSYNDSASRRVEDLWVAQSLEELQAVYADSKCINDFTAEYDEAFFKDNAVILWAAHEIEGGLVDLQLDRIVKSGNKLCLVQKLIMRFQMPYDHFERFVINVSKADLAGIDTITICTEYEYKEV